MFLCLSICLNTLVLGLHQVIVLGKFTAWLALPMLWAINNAGRQWARCSEYVLVRTALYICCLMSGANQSPKRLHYSRV